MSAVQALLGGLVDYAGLFPPAGLALEPAIRNYAAYQHSADSWMLGRFVCPIARLPELDPFVALFSPQRPLALSALTGKNPSPDSFLDDLRAQIAQLSTFITQHETLVSIGAIEILIPATHAGPDTLAQIDDLLADPTLNRPQPFYEIGPTDRREADTIRTLDSIQIHNGRLAQDPPHRAGFKLRTGGLTPEAFPTPEHIAFTLVACRDRAIPIKFTAGLHHPIRRFDSGVQSHMHGFVNVFYASLSAYAQKAGAAELAQILQDEDPSHFSFTDSGLRWRNRLLTTQQITAARALATSFGSCSFDEPRDDLRALGMLRQ